MEGYDSDYEAYMFKILVVGNAAVGKTSCIKRLVYNLFSEDYKGTIGVDFAFKVMHLADETQVRLQFWDIAGQERYGNLTHAYYKDSYGAFVVADASVTPISQALSEAKLWKKDIDRKVRLLSSDRPIPCVLLLNKHDLVPDGTLSDEDLRAFAEENGFTGMFLTSAKTGSGLKEATQFLVDCILELVRGMDPPEKEDSDIITPGAPEPEEPTKSECKC